MYPALSNAGKKIFYSFFIAAVFFSPQIASAIDVVNVILTPNTPGANQDVTIKLESFTTPLEVSNIIWYQGGKPIQEGSGLTSWKARTGNFGDSITYDVVIITPQGNRIDKKIVLAPIEIDILWEADGYIPPFYKGKALPSTGGKIKVAAIPRFNSTQGDPSKYVYTWTIDRTKRVGEGLGKSSAIIPAPKQGIKTNISAMVSEYEGNRKGSNSLDIISVSPKIEIYQHLPLLGLVTERSARIHGLNTTEDSITLQAVPYFFTKEDRESGDIQFSWYVNGVSAPNTTNTERIVIKANDMTSYGVRVSALNINSLLQEAVSQGNILFNTK